MYNIKTFVLYKRLGSDMGKPQVFFSYKKAHKEMSRQFRVSVREHGKGNYVEDESMVLADGAVIVTSGEWEEWIIDECELSVPVYALKRMAKEAASANKTQMRR